jgi:hypothetical protein
MTMEDSENQKTGAPPTEPPDTAGIGSPESRPRGQRSAGRASAEATSRGKKTADPAIEAAARRIAAMPGWDVPNANTGGWELIKRGAPAIGPLAIAAIAVVALLPYLGAGPSSVTSPQNVVQTATTGAQRQQPPADIVPFPDGTSIPTAEITGRIDVVIATPRGLPGLEWVVEASDWTTGNQEAITYTRQGGAARLNVRPGSYRVTAYGGTRWNGSGFDKPGQTLKSRIPMVVREGSSDGAWVLGAPSESGGLPTDPAPAPITATRR